MSLNFRYNTGSCKTTERCLYILKEMTMQQEIEVNYRCQRSPTFSSPGLFLRKLIVSYKRRKQGQTFAHRKEGIGIPRMMVKVLPSTSIVHFSNQSRLEKSKVLEEISPRKCNWQNMVYSSILTGNWDREFGAEETIRPWKNKPTKQKWSDQGE